MSKISQDLIEEYNKSVLKLIELANSENYDVKIEETKNGMKLFIKKIDRKNMIVETYSIPLDLTKESDVVFYESARKGMAHNKSRREDKERVKAIKEQIDVAIRLAEAEIIKSLSSSDVDLYFLHIKK